MVFVSNCLLLPDFRAYSAFVNDTAKKYGLCTYRFWITLKCQIKVHKLKKMDTSLGNLDIHFFFISVLFKIWTCQMNEWEDISKPSNIHNEIKLFTVLHNVAKQPIKIAKKPLVCLVWWLPWLQGINF